MNTNKYAEINKHLTNYHKFYSFKLLEIELLKSGIFYSLSTISLFEFRIFKSEISNALIFSEYFLLLFILSL